MAESYLTVTNKLLRDSNEVVLTSAGFASAVGVQAYAKDIVNRSYLELCAEEEEWPFLMAAESNANEPYAGNTVIETVEGQRWYLLKTGSTDLTTDYSKIDWKSFYITTQGATGRTTPYLHENLKYIPLQQWREGYAALENADAGGDQIYGPPKRVMTSLDGRYFGLSPIPDGAYKVYYTAWVQPTQLSAYDDTFVVPERYIPVILQRARYYFYMFKKDYQEATLADREYKKGLSRMRLHLIGRQTDNMRDDRYTR